MSTVTVKPQPGTPVEEPAPFDSYVSAYFRRVKGGDMGALPAIIALAVLVAVFSYLRPAFFTPLNLWNLIPQGAAVTVIAMGLIFVLLLGEIDLSAGYTSGVCAALMAKLLADFGMPWYVAVLGAIAAGTVIGLFLGTLVAKVRIPSFVVTLAAFLGFQGLVLLLIKGGNIVPVNDPVIRSIGNNNLSPALGWSMFALIVGGFGAAQLGRMIGRRRRGLQADPVSIVALRIAALALVVGLTVFVLNLERSRNAAFISNKGVPVVVPVLVVLLVALTFLLKRTRYGLHIYAVGGNREAARRAGINTDWIRISAFMLCSAMASIGGIIAASRAGSVDANTGGSNVLLYSVGAAVIGGTSLFGGKGRILDAVLGGVVVAVIINGMGLLDIPSGYKYIITGSVLLLAAGVDALSRRRYASAGVR